MISGLLCFLCSYVFYLACVVCLNSGSSGCNISVQVVPGGPLPCRCKCWMFLAYNNHVDSFSIHWLAGVDLLYYFM